MSIAQRIRDLGLTLPSGTAPAANYANAVRTGNLLFIAGKARVVEVQGFVNATEDFEDHAKVLNGCSDLLVEVFGERGIHARSVFGATSLRSGVPVILKGVIEITGDPS